MLSAPAGMVLLLPEKDKNERVSPSSNHRHHLHQDFSFFFFFFFLVRYHDDNEVDDVLAVFIQVLSLQLATASLNCICRIVPNLPFRIFSVA